MGVRFYLHTEGMTNDETYRMQYLANTEMDTVVWIKAIYKSNRGLCLYACNRLGKTAGGPLLILAEDGLRLPTTPDLRRKVSATIGLYGMDNSLMGAFGADSFNLAGHRNGKKVKTEDEVADDIKQLMGLHFKTVAKPKKAPTKRKAAKR